MQDAAKPVSELDFPSVTICSTGLNMEAVRRAFYNDFANWKIDNKEKVSKLGENESLNAYMEEKYAMSPGEGNILETIKAMNSPTIGEEDEEKGNTAALTSNLVSCSQKNGNEVKRKKRSDQGKLDKINGQHVNVNIAK